ncbi:hypothetical protein [Shewanella putrefaciens]|uniref:hypothetical protein n=1 Tax=Shewanella putrefaciens TaxID=24 RepID=UPI0018E8FF3E|nr:hypothetical protein [Shewanella putrefaciens]
MDMTITLSLVVSSLIIIGGWYVAHWFTSRRDYQNKKREKRLDYLINAYRIIGSAAARKPNSEEFKKLEEGFHDVQLFGSSEQLQLLNEIFISHSKTGGADLDPLLNSLRTELRNILGLEKANAALKFFRTQR